MVTVHENASLKIRVRGNFQRGKVSRSAKSHAFITICTAHFIINSITLFGSQDIRFGDIVLDSSGEVIITVQISQTDVKLNKHFVICKI